MTHIHTPHQSAPAVPALLIGAALGQSEPLNPYLDEALTACQDSVQAGDTYDALCALASYKIRDLDKEGDLLAWMSAIVNADLSVYGHRKRDEKYIMSALRDSLGYSLGLPDHIATGGTHHELRNEIDVRSIYVLLRLLEGTDGNLLAGN